MQRESEFQRKLIEKLKRIFPGCIIYKNQAGYIQGFPDLTIFFKDKWATLEVKRSESSPREPNQEYFVKLMDEMSFSRFIFPENAEVVLSELQNAFQC